MKLQKLTCGPVVKGVEEDYGKHFIRIWGRGDIINWSDSCFLVIKIKKKTDIEYGEVVFCEVARENDYTGLMSFTQLDAGTEYEYMIGYVNHSTFIPSGTEFDWELADNGTFKTDSDEDDLSFIFGSCRRYSKVGPVVLFGTGESGDIIYGSIKSHSPDFFLSVGDQVYHDPMGALGRARSLPRMRKRYRTVRNFPQIKSLMANIPTYEICDDHDCHCNNTNWSKRTEEPRIFKAGIRSYKEYQHLFGTIECDKLWYTFDRKNATFFVFDTRSKRDERLIDDNGNKKIQEIVDQSQIDAFTDWIKYPEHDNKVKFVVSPTPLASQKDSDSWFGFPEQQKIVLELIAKTPKTYILTGDAHCARIATYILNDDPKCRVTEILSSGLVAVNHDTGKKYDVGDDLTGYDEHNDFPFVLDNSYSNGLKITTLCATKTYPSPNKPQNIRDKILGLKQRVIDNVFTKLRLKDNILTIEIYNQDNKLLKDLKIMI